MKYILIILYFLIIKLGIDKYFNLKMNKKYLGYTIMQIISFSVLLIFFFSKNLVSFFDTILIAIGLLFLTFLIFYFQKQKEHQHLFAIFSIFIIGILIEIFICNFRFFQTLTYQEKAYSLDKLTTNINEEDNDNFYIEIKDINKEVKNIFLDLNKNENYELTIYASDEGNELYYSLPKREVSEKILKSSYINLNLNGKCHKLKLDFSFKNNSNFILNKIVINKRIPIFFNSLRCLLIISIILFIYCFRSKSFLYKIKLKDFKYQKILILVLILIQIFSISYIGNNAIKSLKENKNDTYNKLADSLINKRTYLIDEHNSESILNNMKNPYDAALRKKLFDEKNESFLWDTAFYKGHYYVYFGVAPVVLFYVPYKLITHHNLPTAFLIYLAGIITTILIALLLYQIIKKLFKNISLGIFILLDLLLVFTIGLIYLVKMPNSTYSLPIIMALMFTMLGLNLWCGLIKSKKLIKTKMALGSLSLALVAGCRPQLLLGSLLIIPILINFYKENKKELNKKDYLKYILAIVLLYLVIAILLMLYNYVRFNSPFDFGANYNLTTNDMTHRGFKLGRIPLGLVIYLFNPPNFANVFPYLSPTRLQTNYMGATIYEPLYGGLLVTSLIYLISLFLPKFKKVINNKLIYSSCMIMLLSAFIIIIIDTELSGILLRYVCDFAWLFAFPTVIIILAMENKKFKYKDLFHKIVFILITLALIYAFFAIFVSEYDYFKIVNKDFWLYFYYLVQFWI